MVDNALMVITFKNVHEEIKMVSMNYLSVSLSVYNTPQLPTGGNYGDNS